MVDLVGLRLLHALDDVVVLDLADAHEGGEQRHRTATAGFSQDDFAAWAASSAAPTRSFGSMSMGSRELAVVRKSAAPILAYLGTAS